MAPRKFSATLLPIQTRFGFIHLNYIIDLVILISVARKFLAACPVTPVPCIAHPWILAPVWVQHMYSLVYTEGTGVAGHHFHLQQIRHAPKRCPVGTVPPRYSVLVPAWVARALPISRIAPFFNQRVRAGTPLEKSLGGRTLRRSASSHELLPVCSTSRRAYGEVAMSHRHKHTQPQSLSEPSRLRRLLLPSSSDPSSSRPLFLSGHGQ